MLRKIFLPVLLAAALLLSACQAEGELAPDSDGDEAAASVETAESGEVSPDESRAQEENPESASDDAESSEWFTDRDLNQGWDAGEAVSVALDGTSAVCDSDSVTVSDGTVTINAAGTYVLTGCLQGMVIVDAADSDKVQIVLDGADITSETSAAIYVRSADKVFLTTAAGTENTLTNGGTYVDIDENGIDAVIFSQSDLTLNGEGTLTVRAEAGHGVVSKDDLKVTGGTYAVTAASHGLSGQDSVRICGGSLAVTAGKDGIRTEADDGGFIFVSGGEFSLCTDGDGISADGDLQVTGGTFSVTAGGGSANASSAQSGTWGGFFGQGPDTESDGTVSCKGLKAGGNVTISGGNFTLDCADDALHANGDLSVSDGEFLISSGDDGLHADNALEISGGTVAITTCYEGIEGLTIDISGGAISLCADDDGLNAAGGADTSGFGGWGGDIFGASEGACIRISGGTLSIVSGGDGIDSNGDLFVEGGEVYISGPTSNADAAIDYGGTGAVSGGTVVAVGSSGMAQNFGSSSTQGSMLVSVSGDAGSEISLADSRGNLLISWTAEKSFSAVVISCAALAEGESYTLSVDDTAVSIVMSSLIYSDGGGFGGMPGGNTDGDRGPGSIPGGGGTPGGSVAPEGGEGGRQMT